MTIIIAAAYSDALKSYREYIDIYQNFNRIFHLIEFIDGDVDSKERRRTIEILKL